MAPRVAATPSVRRRRWPWVLVVLLLVVPTLEIAVIIAVGKVIGAWPTLLLLVAESALGAWLVKREGARTWSALNAALSSGRMPSRQLADAALVLVGGTLLLTPGFVTDLFGFCLHPAVHPTTGAVGARDGGDPSVARASGPHRPQPSRSRVPSQHRALGRASQDRVGPPPQKRSSKARSSTDTDTRHTQVTGPSWGGRTGRRMRNRRSSGGALGPSGLSARGAKERKTLLK